MRLVFLAGSLILAASSSRADEAKGAKVEHTTYPDYFQKNTAGLKGDVSFLAFTDKDAFARVFQLRPPLMGGKRSVPVPDQAFEKQLVFAVIHRGNAITTYMVEKVTADGDTIYVQYKAETGAPSTAMFASPLIVSAPRGKATKVVFIENGKTVGSADVKARE